MTTLHYRYYLLISFLILNSIIVYSQDLSTKYGKVTTDELKMSRCELDTTANAVVLYKRGKTRYEYKDGFNIKHEIETKIKILTQEGTDYANVTLPYYNEKSSDGGKEYINEIEGYAYNLENGKVIKTKMEKDFIVKERINDKYMQVKFSIPNVKAGTVIEYKYHHASEYSHILEDWEMQQDIPVLYGEYDLTIPNYYNFNMSLWGVHKIDYTQSQKKMRAEVKGPGGLHSNTLYIPVTNYIFTARNLLPLKDEPYLWCADDFRTKINFELSGIQFPGTEYKSYTTKWEDIDALLMKDSRFGEMLKIENPFLSKMKELDYKTINQEEKIVQTYQLLKNNISWDGTYRLYANPVNDILKKGSGSNADINFLLIRMLRDAGIIAKPVVISRRDRGVIPVVYPSLMKLNTFVVGIETEKGKYSLLDGSVTTGYINVLPPVLMADKGRIISSKDEEKWIPLNDKKNNQFKSVIMGKLDENGLLSAERTVSHRGQFASSLRKSITSKDSANIAEILEDRLGIEITDYKQKGLNEFTPEIKETYVFTKNITVNDGYIYLNPMIFSHQTTHPFIQADRKLPVEFPFLETAIYTVSLDIPEGYVVEELPKPASISIDKNLAICRYQVRMLANKLTLSYHYNLNHIAYDEQNYSALQEFWNALINKNNEVIVLKKQ